MIPPNWNRLNPAVVGGGTQAISVANFIDSTGLATNIGLQAVGTNSSPAPLQSAYFGGYNYAGSSVSSPGFPADVKRESFFGNDTNSNPSWTFSGFDPNDDLTFTFFASRMGVADNREGLYEVVGATTRSTTLDASNNDTKTASVTVKADAGGNVVLNMSKGPGNNNTSGFFYLNAMTIEVIPEPSSALLVLVAGLGLCVVRRRG